MSIVRIGLAETDGFAEGYEAIFGKKDDKKKDATPATTTDAEKKDAPNEEESKK